MLTQTETHRFCESSTYNYIYNKESGFFLRWGENFDDDPQWSPSGPEIMDLEISTVPCQHSKLCKHCYKDNTGSGENMSLETFKVILSKMPSCMQIAFGLTDIDSNPDFIPIMEHCRLKGVVPNYTTSGYKVDENLAQKTAQICGAVAVSTYPHNLVEAYEAIKLYLDAGMKQVNIHLLYHRDNMDFCRSVLDNGRNEEVNAIVLLAAKPVGRGSNLVPATRDQFDSLVNHCMQEDIPLGFDSCSAPSFERWVKNSAMPPEQISRLIMCSDRCEAGCFSLYCNVRGEISPCSFTDRGDGISLLDHTLEEIWNDGGMNAWRKNLWKNKRYCPAYNMGE